MARTYSTKFAHVSAAGLIATCMITVCTQAHAGDKTAVGSVASESQLQNGDTSSGQTSSTKTRPVKSKVWDYIRANNLQKPTDKRVIVSDTKQ